MKRKYIATFLVMTMISAQFITGCGAEKTTQKDTEQVILTEDQVDSTEAQVASKEELAASEELTADGLTAVTGDQIKDGTYEIDVESSSSMFRIDECELTVKDGEMTATMTMGGKGYLKVFMGTGEEAVGAEEEDYIPYEEDSLGLHTYTVPVEALNQAIDCAAFSKDREKWYDRTLIFHASSIPVDALEEGVVTTVESLGLADGTYSVEVSLEGGSGKALIESPTTLIVENGKAQVEIAWSSPNYDYMKLDDVKYELADQEGNSNFILPIKVFDWNISVIADTIAMSEPHEIAYTIVLDSSTITEAAE